MKNLKFIDKLENAIKKEKKALLDHIFIQNLLSGKYTKEDIKVFAEQYFLLSDSFCTMMFFASANINSEKIRLPILYNLWDEHGNGNLQYSHRELLKKFLFSLGIFNLNTIVALPSTNKYINNMIEFYKNSSDITSLSALGSGCESLTTEQYSKIYKALKKQYKFTDEELIFFKEHINHDPKHSQDINIILDDLLNESNINLAINSAKKAILEEISFWDGIYLACEKSNKALDDE